MFEIFVVSIALLLSILIFAISSYNKAVQARQIAKDAQKQVSILTNRVRQIEIDRKQIAVVHDSRGKSPIQALSSLAPSTAAETASTPQTEGIFFEDTIHSDSMTDNPQVVDTTHSQTIESDSSEPGFDADTDLKTSESSLANRPLPSQKLKAPGDETQSEKARHPETDRLIETDQSHAGHVAKTGEQTTEPLIISDLKPLTNVDVNSIEMKLGTYWFVRIGVMLLLTGLAFLAYYKKQFFIDLPPAAKVSGNYLLCLVLSAVGFWLSKSQEKLRNFGHVLVAGGLAGAYFTIYASYLFEPIKVIENLHVAVACLCVWGVLVAWISDRLKSETMAIFTVGASYYATHIPLIHSGQISQWLLISSNLILAVASIGFMVRNRWFKLPFVSMLVTYAGFISTQSGWKVLPMPLLIMFTISLWSVYSVAVFAAKNNDFSQIRRVWFLTLNNAAMFGLISLSLVRHTPASFWLASILISGVLFGMAVLAKVALKNQSLSTKAYTVQAILLLNLGIMTFDMSSSLLGLILAAEGLIFAMLTIRLENRITRGACLILSLIATFFTSSNILQRSDDFFTAGLIVAGLLLVSARFIAFVESADRRLLRPQTGFLAILGFFAGTISLLVGFNYLPLLSGSNEWLPVAIISIPVIFLIAHYRLRIREFVILSQVCGMIGIVISLSVAATIESFSYPMLVTGLLILSLVHWWYWERNTFLNCCSKVPFAKSIPNSFSALYSAGFVAKGLLMTISVIGDGPEWIWFGSAIAVLVAFYSVTTRAFFLGLFAQLFLILSSLKMLSVCLNESEPNALITFVPIAAVCLINLLVSTWQWRLVELTNVDSTHIHKVQMGLRLSAAALSLIWIQSVVPSDWLVLAYALAGITFFVLNTIRNHPDLQWISVAYSIVALFSFFAQVSGGEACWQSGLSLLVVMLFQQFARRNEDQLKLSNVAHNLIMLISAALMMIWVTVKLSDFATIEIIGIRTLAWTGLGVVYFGLGLGFRERAYRLMGLVTLALALLSIIPSIWSLSTEIKILSVFVMGGTFVALGFIYSRFKESLKKLL